MIGVTIAAMSGVSLAAPMRLRAIFIPIIGVMLGSAITADIISQIGLWAITMAILPIVLGAMGTLSYLVYRRIGGYDPVTAFYSCMPGGLNDMVILGEEAGGDARKIALSHAARILIVIFFIAIIFGLFFGISSGEGRPKWLGLMSITWLDYVILGGCALAGGPFGKALRMPAAAIFGSMVLSGLAHMIGWVTVAPPTLFVIAAQIVMGTVIGSRFVGSTLREVARDLKLAVLATALMLTVGFGLAVCISWLVDMPIAQIYLAFAPGGLTEMSLLTLAIDQDVAFVSVAHLVRIALVIAVAPIVFRLLCIGRFTQRQRPD